MSNLSFYNIVLELPKEINQYLVKDNQLFLPRKVNMKDLYYEKNTFPHTSLYSITISRNKVVEILEILEVIILNTKPIQLEICFTRKNGTGIIIVTSELLKLYDQIIEGLCCIKTGWSSPKNIGWMNKIPDKNMASLQKYGSYLFWESYNANLKFKSFINETNDVVIIKKIKSGHRHEIINLNKISLDKVNLKSGTVTRIKSFELSF